MSHRTPQVIEVDALDSWPKDIRSFVSDHAHVADQPSIDLAICEGMAKLLKGRRLRGYHATRLLAHEVDWIRTRGLRRLTHSLVHERLAGAVHAGVLTESERATLELRDWFADAGFVRHDDVSLLLSSAPFSEGQGTVAEYFNYWGGEAMFKPHMHNALGAKLRALGAAMVVVVDLVPTVEDATRCEVVRSFGWALRDVHAERPYVQRGRDVPHTEVIDVVPRSRFRRTGGTL